MCDRLYSFLLSHDQLSYPIFLSYFTYKWLLLWLANRPRIFVRDNGARLLDRVTLQKEQNKRMRRELIICDWSLAAIAFVNWVTPHAFLFFFFHFQVTVSPWTVYRTTDSSYSLR